MVSNILYTRGISVFSTQIVKQSQCQMDFQCSQYSRKVFQQANVKLFAVFGLQHITCFRCMFCEWVCNVQQGVQFVCSTFFMGWLCSFLLIINKYQDCFGKYDHVVKQDLKNQNWGLQRLLME
eukprot:TRINITY_DN2713_c0_g1_i1.p3 TRINITY_DN2713_c0_g1~~TRINITY_DN2713_c0_g1_i1.p3  ORF type:complete len:123 (+),score=0.48 TRINITY_DN2713_c0_g1_i1:438-806(+)